MFFQKDKINKDRILKTYTLIQDISSDLFGELISLYAKYEDFFTQYGIHKLEEECDFYLLYIYTGLALEQKISYKEIDYVSYLVTKINAKDSVELAFKRYQESYESYSSAKTNQELIATFYQNMNNQRINYFTEASVIFTSSVTSITASFIDAYSSI